MSCREPDVSRQDDIRYYLRFIGDVWHMEEEGQFSHPHPHEFLPSLLFLIIFTTIKETTVRRTAHRMMVARLSNINANMKSLPFLQYDYALTEICPWNTLFFSGLNNMKQKNPSSISAKMNPKTLMPPVRTRPI